VITATYNSAATIRDTLACIASQTHRDVEHIIVDAVSTDNTLEIVKSFRMLPKPSVKKTTGFMMR